MCKFNVDFSKIFWGLRPQTPILGRGYGAPPQTLPPRRSGASRLRASLGTFGPSIVVSLPLTKILATRLCISTKLYNSYYRYTTVDI